jgi:hypothetical protein
LESALAEVVGEPVRIEFREASEAHSSSPAPAATQIPQAQLKKQVASHPVVKAAIELFDGTVVAVERPTAVTTLASESSDAADDGEN